MSIKRAIKNKQKINQQTEAAQKQKKTLEKNLAWQRKFKIATCVIAEFRALVSGFFQLEVRDLNFHENIS